MSEPPDYWDYEDATPDYQDDDVGDGLWRAWLDDAASDVVDFMFEAGITEPSQIVVDLSEDLDPQFLRNITFPTIGQALNYLFDAGVIAFSKIVRFTDEEGREDYKVYITGTP
jgi:hypothetical protein